MAAYEPVTVTAADFGVSGETPDGAIPVRTSLPTSDETLALPFYIIRSFVAQSEPKEWFKLLDAELKPLLKQYIIRGKNEPRHGLYVSDIPDSYAYSSVRRAPIPFSSAPIVKTLCDYVSGRLGLTFTACLIQYYDEDLNKNARVDWHSDTTKQLNPAVIVSLSFGGTRCFQFRDLNEESRVYSGDLTDTDFAYMGETCQVNYEHRIKKDTKAQPRYVLTFRCVVGIPQ